MVGKEILKVENVSKTFGTVRALNKVQFSLKEGECHALVGENGAGKSTLIKILMGIYERDEGEIFIDGRPVVIKNPNEAQKMGLAAVYQDVYLAPQLSIGENFFLGKLGKGWVNWNKIYSDSKDILHSIQIDLDTRTLLSDLPIASQEMIAIAKAVHQNAKVLIFDEPTALLTNDETAEIFRIIKDLKSLGHAIIYISHRMEEIFEICDRVTVLKDGTYVGTEDIDSLDENKLVAMMVGRSFEDMYSIKHYGTEKTVLEVKNLASPKNIVKDVSFNLKEGEIIGLFGLVGSGRTESVRMIFGADPKGSGSIHYLGKAADFASPASAIHHHLGFISEDRKNQSIALELSVEENINLPSYTIEQRAGFVDFATAHKAAMSYIERLKIKLASPSQQIRYLSGGNQQKAVIAKWLRTGVRLLIADEPTIGVDVGAKVEIYKLFENLTKEGVSIILISSYLPEIMGLTERTFVFYEGRVMEEVPRQEYSEEKLVALASGLK